MVPQFIGIEGASLGSVNPYAPIKLKMLGHIQVRLYEAGYSVAEYSPASVKAFACHGHAKKGEVAEAVDTIWGYRFTDSKGKMQDDLTDAFVISQLTLNHAGILYLNNIMTYLDDKQRKQLDRLDKSSEFASMNDIFLKYLS